MFEVAVGKPAEDCVANYKIYHDGESLRPETWLSILASGRIDQAVFEVLPNRRRYDGRVYATAPPAPSRYRSPPNETPSYRPPPYLQTPQGLNHFEKRGIYFNPLTPKLKQSLVKYNDSSTERNLAGQVTRLDSSRR